MTTTTLTDIVIGLALIIWIGYRQLNWTPVAPERMWRMPAIMAIIGVGILLNGGVLDHVTGTDLAVLAIEVVVSVGLGAVMGLMAHFRPMSAEATTAYLTKNARKSGSVPNLETRTGWVGMALWLILIATRVGGEVVAHMTDSMLLTSVGVILLTVALNRAVRIIVITQRADRVTAAATVAGGSRLAA